MGLADSVEEGFDTIVEAVEFIADPPALTEIKMEYPIFPRDSNWTMSAYGPLWKTHGYFDIEHDLSGVNGILHGYLCGNSNGVSPGATWGTDELIKIPGGNPYQGSAYFAGASDTWQVDNSGEWFVRFLRIDGVPQRRSAVPYDKMARVASITATPASGPSKGTIVIQFAEPTFSPPSDARIEIFKRVTVSEMLDFSLTFTPIPAMSTSGSLFGFSVDNAVAETINIALEEVINPALDSTFEMITDAVIDAGLTVIDFITQFVWKDITRDFLIKWLVRIVAYGLRVVVGMPSYFIGKFVLDRVIPGIDSLNLRTKVDTILSAVNIQPFPGAEADSVDVQKWLETALQDVSVAGEGLTSANTGLPLFEIISVVGELFNVMQEGDPNAD